MDARNTEEPTSPFAFLNGPSIEVAPRLLGCRLVREVDGQKLVARIVEAEAYDQTDPASHSYRGPSPRSAVMFGPAGYWYVYISYGLHFCCNVATGPTGHGAGVLIRAIEPLEGEEQMVLNRGGIIGRNITNGPGKLCQALKVDKSLSGYNVRDLPFQLVLNEPLSADEIVQTTRIGISQAIDQPWRFYIKGNPYVSRR